MVTSRDVAREAGVSQATVSRVMSAPERVHATTRAHVLATMEKLGYVPNAAAQTMKTGLTNTIGVVVDDIKNPFYPELLDALTEVFDCEGMRVIIWKSDGGKSQAALQAIRQGLIDGIVFTTILEESEPLHAALETGHPIVLVNRVIEGINCDQVTSQNARGGELVADYFVDAERSRIAYIGGPAKVSTSREREAGFRARLTARGAPLDEAYVRAGDYSYASGYESMRDLLAMGTPPDAIFCCNDLVAFGALDCARKTSPSLAKTPWVVGYDDVQMASWGAYGLTTVRQDTRQMAQTAAQLLIQRIKDPSRAIEFVEYPSALIIRESTPHAIQPVQKTQPVQPLQPAQSTPPLDASVTTPVTTPAGTFSFRPARAADLAGIVALIQNDQRTNHGTVFDAVTTQAYERAFVAISADPAQLLMAVLSPAGADAAREVVATLQLTFIPGLSRGAGTRLQIEAVLIRADYRGQSLGTAMIAWALEEGRRRGAALAQLTTATSREGTGEFYRRLGFEPSHVGFKITL
jgi:LacI family transcriptional regulator